MSIKTTFDYKFSVKSTGKNEKLQNLLRVQGLKNIFGAGFLNFEVARLPKIGTLCRYVYTPAILFSSSKYLLSSSGALSEEQTCNILSLKACPFHF